MISKPKGKKMNKIDDIMTNNPACCLPNETLDSIARLMVTHDCGEIPVVNNMSDKRVIGVITDRDICCRSVAKGIDPMKMTAKECMTSPAIVIDLETSLDECFNLMEENQIRRIPVIDEDLKCCGMVSIADIARHVEGTTTAEVIRYISNPSFRNPVYVS
jgi:CBS domain-containing protein